MRITENDIIDALRHKQEKEASIQQQMQHVLDEIHHIESAEYEYDMLRAISLKGKSFDSVKTSRTNQTTDTHQILEKFKARQAEEKEIYKRRFGEKVEELLRLESIWRIYTGLDYRLFRLLRLRYAEGQKWQAISRELGLSNRQITEWTGTAIQAILYELENGEGASRNPEFADKAIYKKAALAKNKKAKGKNKGVQGQMSLPGLEGGE